MVDWGEDTASTVDSGGMFGFWKHWFGKSGFLPVETETARAVAALWRYQRYLYARSEYTVLYERSRVAAQLAKDFFLEAWRELSSRHRVLASNRALARALRMRVRPTSGQVIETGSAAAIAKRMNPLGAPPHLV
jgi:hypothetical protein